MADRQSNLRLIRAALPSLLLGLAVTVGSLVITGNVTAGGTITTPTVYTDAVLERQAGHGVYLAELGGVWVHAGAIYPGVVKPPDGIASGAQIDLNTQHVIELTGGVTLDPGPGSGDIVLHGSAGPTDDLTLGHGALATQFNSFGTAGISIAGGAALIDSGGNITAARLAQTVGSLPGHIPTTLATDYPTAAPSTTSETALDTVTVPGSSQSVVGQTIRVRAWGVAAANTNSKVVRLRLSSLGGGLAGTAVGACTFAASTDTVWTATWTITRTGASAQTVMADCNASAASDALSTATATRTDTLDMDLVVSVQNATTAADLTLKGVDVELLAE